MKILIVDDSAAHQRAAVEQFKGSGHELFGFQSEASWECAERTGEPLGEIYKDGLGYITGGFHPENAVVPPPADVALIDLLMPPSDRMQSQESLTQKHGEMPVGIFLALLAAKRGVKLVAVFTDSDHHSHPASACIDAFQKSESKPIPFTVDGAQVFLVNNRLWFTTNSKGERVKDWAALLKYMLEYVPEAAETRAG
ncbi:MAG TPA: response regulator [Candidatus Paceibacterota bacterium]|jgi:CheY-like chemotaxis protein|nr:response regulator [Candidatus Paceibacterota bacterium]